MVQIRKYYKKGHYHKLLAQEADAKTMHSIRKDLERTYPDEPYFCGEYSPGRKALQRVLKAISIELPEIGYVQSMNFIVGLLLLLSGGNEVESFWFFVTLAKRPEFGLLGFYDEDFTLVSFLTFVFTKLARKRESEVQEHIEEMFVPETLWIQKWLMTLYLHSFSFPMVIRIWDLMISKDITALLQVGISILHTHKEDILNFELEHFVEFLNGFQEVKAEEGRPHEE